MLNPVIDFTFSDNPDWRSKLTSISFTHNGSSSFEYIIHFTTTTPGELKTGHIMAPGNWVWNFKATGYPDVVVTFTN